MSEQPLIAIYVALTGSSEGLARSVLIHLDWKLHQNQSEFS